MGTYRHDYVKFDENVLCADWMVAEMLVRAERVLERAIETAPYDDKDLDGVHYRDSFVVDAGIREEGSRRAFGRVSNHDMPTALFVEFGTVNNPRYRTLGNALDGAAGGAIHGRTRRAIFKGTQFEPPKPKPRKPPNSKQAKQPKKPKKG